MKKTLLFIFGIVLFSGIVYAGGVPDPFGDYDSDGILNLYDNCYYIYNPLQINSNSNGYGDACDPVVPKYCGDGICNGNENFSDCSIDCSYSPLPPTTPECVDNSNCSSDYECINEICVKVNCTNYNGNIVKKSRNHVAIFCYPNWECSGWGECNRGLMTRICRDTNYCEIEFNRPLEETGCEEVIMESSLEKNDFNFQKIMVGVFIFLIIILAFIFLIGLK